MKRTAVLSMALVLFSCDSGGRGIGGGPVPRPGRKIQVQQVQEVGEECRSTGLVVVDHGEATRDIWAGREEAETGKQAGAEESFSFVFNKPVKLEALLAHGRLEGVVENKSEGTQAPVRGKCEGGEVSRPLRSRFPSTR